jgi:hypothetical protein
MVFGDIYLTGAFIEQYHSIGWPQLYLGRVGTSWEKAYHAYSGRSTSEEIASHWSIAFISTLWEYARHIRNQRNSIIYGAEEAQAAQTIANNQQQIQNLFAEFQEDPSMILPHHCHQFTSKSPMLTPYALKQHIFPRQQSNTNNDSHSISSLDTTVRYSSNYSSSSSSDSESTPITIAQNISSQIGSSCKTPSDTPHSTQHTK